jgi:hypothetical protein
MNGLYSVSLVSMYSEMLKLRRPGEEGEKTCRAADKSSKIRQICSLCRCEINPLPETSYTLPVGVDIRIRHYHRTQARRVTEFVVQLEIEIRNEWKPVIRYDSAHGFAHIDRYNLRGRARKERLELSFSEALTRAERDIKQNWSVYRERFLRGEWP